MLQPVLMLALLGQLRRPTERLVLSPLDLPASKRQRWFR
jgi:hypothetical protein